jgi:hypothetical protein
MSADKPPLMFEVRFGALHPVNTAARDAVKTIPAGPVRIEIKRTRANEARRGFYWTMLDVAAEAMTDRTGFPFDQELLHNTLKAKLGLGQTFTTPSGHTIFKPQSTSNRAMTEPERARWTDRCANVLSHWLGCEITELMDEARRREGVAA